MFLDDTACNLASLNLIKFYDPKTQLFDVDSYRHATRIWTLILEISVYMAQFPSPIVAQKSFDFRTLGLGYANMGTLLMVQGLPYDSDEGRAQCGAITAIMHAASFVMSAEIAAELGPFARFEANRQHMLRVIRNHRRASYNAPHWRAVRGAHDRPRRPSTLNTADALELPDRRGPQGMRPDAQPGREVRLPQRPGHLHRPDRHHRPGHGLRHHRRRARLRAGQIQEALPAAVTSRSSTLRCRRRSKRLGYEPSTRARRSSAIAAGPARSTWMRRHHQQRDAARRRVSPTRSWRSVDRPTSAGLRHRLRLQPLDARCDDFPSRRSAVTDEQLSAWPELQSRSPPSASYRRRRSTGRQRTTSAAP